MDSSGGGGEGEERNQHDIPFLEDLRMLMTIIHLLSMLGQKC